MSRRLVLDTNVWLDWLVFDDAGVTPLKDAHAGGTAEIVIDDACEAELARVLAYPRRTTTLDPGRQAGCLARCREITIRFAPGMKAGNIPLPSCRDPDDQKFLELARDCGAHFLVTRDQALLVLAQRPWPRLPFQIVSPAGCAAALRSRT